MNRVFKYDDIPVVQTTVGAIKGYMLDGVYIFKGIPYAAAQRFQMPTEVEPWEGVFDATSYGYTCPLLTQEKPGGELLVPHRYWLQDEACQNLNIWTKEINPEERKPVLVWLHGGGHITGSAIEQVAYDGFNLAEYGDVVVVSINHRLNILGFLDLSHLDEKYRNSGNAGLADIVAALKWIQRNIAAFGGDAGNVTIFGQSGGGLKVAELMQIQEAEGLFHRCMIMSGITDGKNMPILQGDGRRITTALLNQLGLSEYDAEKLETVPYRILAEAYNKVSPSIAREGCYVGGEPLANDFFPGQPLITGFTEHAKAIPLMVGSVYADCNLDVPSYNKYELSESEMKVLIQQQYGNQTEKAIELFKAAYPSKKIVELLNIDRSFREPSKALAKAHCLGGMNNTYLYNFALDFPYQHGKEPWHCADIPFFFHNTDKVEICAIPEGPGQLEEIMSGALISFARTGNPNHSGMPRWPYVTPEKEPTMIFGSECTVANNYDDGLLELIDETLLPFSFIFTGSQYIPFNGYR